MVSIEIAALRIAPVLVGHRHHRSIDQAAPAWCNCAQMLAELRAIQARGTMEGCMARPAGIGAAE
jgi:hypothetical protein